MFFKGQPITVKSDLDVDNLRQANHQNDYISFVTHMDKTLGQSGTIVGIFSYGYEVLFDNNEFNEDAKRYGCSNWAYKKEWLIKRNVNEVNIMEED
jgi:hypothetical protein